MAITNSEEDIDLDVINTNHKTSKSPILLLISQLFSNLGNENNN